MHATCRQLPTSMVFTIFTEDLDRNMTEAPYNKHFQLVAMSFKIVAHGLKENSFRELPAPTGAKVASGRCHACSCGGCRSLGCTSSCATAVGGTACTHIGRGARPGYLASCKLVRQWYGPAARQRGRPYCSRRSRCSTIIHERRACQSL